MRRCLPLVCLAALLLQAPQLHADEAAVAERLTAAGGKLGFNKDKAVTSCDFGESGKLTPELLKELAQLPQLGRLSFGAGLTDEMLAALPELPKLTAIGSNAAAITDDGLKALARQKTLRSLALFHPPKNFTGVGLAHLAKLPDFEGLTVAGSLAFGDEGMAAVGKLTKLTGFRTWHAGVTNEGVRKLAALPKLESLTVGQRLAYNGPACPSDETAPILVEFKSLKTIDLQEARFTAKGLSGLKALSTLKTLKLTGVELPAEELEQLKKDLSGVQITWTEPSEPFQKRIKALFGSR